MANHRTSWRFVVAAPGDATVLDLQPHDIGEPGPGEVVIRQEFISLNYHDIYVRSGAYKTMPYPGTPGIEAAGVIEEVGAGVEGFSRGQRVAYICAEYGAYADRRIIAARHLVPLPAGIAAQTAAATLLKGVTAHMLLSCFKTLHPGDTVLVHAAAGGVGQLLVQLARGMGLRVVGTAGDEAKADLARSLGCEIVAVRGKDDILQTVRVATGNAGVQAVFDGIGAATAHVSLAALAPFGHCCLFGQVTGKPEPIDVARLAERSLSFSRPIVFHHIADRNAYGQSARVLFEGLLDGTIRSPEPTLFALPQLPDAHRALESGATTGSILIVTDAA